MPRYAVKVGEVHLTSDKPITPEERKKAVAELMRYDRKTMPYLGGDVDVMLSVDRH